MRLFTPAGTVTVRIRLPFPAMSGSTQRPSRCCKSSTSIRSSSARRSPQPSRRARIARSRSPVRVAGRRGVEEIVGLFLHQPVPCPVAALLDARHALDRRGHGGVEQLIVGHLPGELADRREPEVDRRGGKALGQERRPVLLDQGLGERRPCPRDPDPAKEGRQPRLIGTPGVDGGDAIEDQIDQPGLGVRVPCRSGLNLEFCSPSGNSLAR